MKLNVISVLADKIHTLFSYKSLYIQNEVKELHTFISNIINAFMKTVLWLPKVKGFTPK